MQTNRSKLEAYAAGYRGLFKDKRLFTGFVGTLQGIIGSQSLRVSRIANSSSLLGTSQHGERRVRRLVHNQNGRADSDAQSLSERLTNEGANRLKGEHEVLLILDESDLRKPFASCIEHLDRVRSLEGELVPGFHTLNVLAIGASGRRAILYHHSFSTREPGFKSTGAEYKKAIDSVTTELRGQGVGRLLWVIDRAGDDIRLMQHIHVKGDCFVTRVQHLNRACLFDNKPTQLARAIAAAPVLASAKLEKRLIDPTAKRYKNKQLAVDIAAVSVELKAARGLEVCIAQVRSALKASGWVLITNLKLRAGEEAFLLERLLKIYRQRWAIEDLFAWSKSSLGWETVQLMSFEALKTLVAFAWIAAAFLHELGVAKEDETVAFLVRLGATHAHARSSPRILATALDHLASYLVVKQFAVQVGGENRLLMLANDVFGVRDKP